MKNEVAQGGADTTVSRLNKFTLDLVTTVSGVASLRPDYERLQRNTQNTMPFTLHEWHMTWCEHFLVRNARIEDRPLFHLIRDPSGACVGIVPLIVSTHRVGPIKIVTISLLGADPGITEIRSSLMEAGHEQIVARVVRDSLLRMRDWDWIHWTGMNGEFGKAIAEGCDIKWQEPLVDYVLDLPDTWEAFRAGLKRNIRESLRHCYNSLKREGHAFEFEVLTEPAAVRTALDRFVELHVMRAQLKGTVHHLDRFASPVTHAFLYAVCERLAARGAVRLFQLKIGGEVVASRLGFVLRDSLYLYYSGFDPAWGRYAVMTTTVAEALKYAIRQGLKTVNLTPGTDVSKTRWGPRAVEYPAAFEQRDRLFSRLARQTYTARLGEGFSAHLISRLIQVRRNWK
jgi:CelD/BcsL family acetyltransferase involved in cellulose biosynthesis